MVLSPLNPRMVVVVLLAFCVSLPMAALSIAKVLLFSFCLCLLLIRVLKPAQNSASPPSRACQVILVCIGIWAASLVWTGASPEDALVAFVKHGKLLTIPLLILLIKDKKEAKHGLVALLAGQYLVMVTSWLMALNVPIPWVERPSGVADPLTQFVPYADSYLDQSIMLAGTAGIVWHFARERVSSLENTLCRLLAIGCLLNVLVLMPGRTGYILAIVTVCLVAIFEIPVRHRLVASLLTPFLLSIALYQGVPQFQERVRLAVQEWNDFGVAPVVGSSIGARLNMWKLSAAAIALQPLVGHGVGNWAPVIKELHGDKAEFVFGPSRLSNPHQELLLWMVELGICGGILFFAFFVSLILDSRGFRLPIRRANVTLAAMLLITCLFNSPLYDDLLGDYFCIALGLLLALGFRDNQEHSTAGFRAKVAH